MQIVTMSRIQMSGFRFELLCRCVEGFYLVESQSLFANGAVLHSLNCAPDIFFEVKGDSD